MNIKSVLNFKQLNNNGRRRARKAILWSALVMSALGVSVLWFTLPHVAFDKFDVDLDHSASNAHAFPGEREEIASVLPSILGHFVRIVSFGDHVVPVWEGKVTTDNLAIVQAAVRSIMLRTPEEERGTAITSTILGEAKAIAAEPGRRALVYMATDGEEDAQNPLVEFPRDSLNVIRGTHFVFAQLKVVPRAASLGTLAGASVQTYIGDETCGRLRDAIFGQARWAYPVRIGGWAALFVSCTMLPLTMLFRPIRSKPVTIPKLTRWVGVETADGRVRAAPSIDEGIFIGFGPAARLSLPTGFPADTLIEVIPIGDGVAEVIYHSGRGMDIGNGACFVRRGQHAEAVDGDALQFGPTEIVRLRITDCEPVSPSNSVSSVLKRDISTRGV